MTIESSSTTIHAAAMPARDSLVTAPFDPAAATATYIDSLGPEALAKAAAYTSGSHWLILWGVLVSALVTWLLVRSGVLERLQARISKPNRQVFVVAFATFALLTLLSLPWTIYSDWWRETAYGRTSQSLADFLGQSAISGLLSAVLAALFFVGVYALIRRAGRRWWLWSGGLFVVASTTLMLLSPVLIEPLFNEYKPVPEGEVRDALVVMARESGVPEDRIFVYDGSRQSNNFTANVSGVFGSARIAISDVAFKGASLDEVKAVTGHEVGHYVLGHIWRGIGLMALMGVVVLFLVDRLYPWFARRFGSRASLAQPAGLPVLVFVVMLLFTVARPVMNAHVRSGERAADRYSLETVNLPDALASALVKTAEYRYPRPHPLQEALFYTHPSVERRVRAAMEWKQAHPAD